MAGKWQDGRFYPGVIQAQYAEETPFTEAVYTILFEDGYEKQITTQNIVGPGFQTLPNSGLKNGQKVFLTLNGREVNGLVISHKPDIDEVLVNVQTNGGDELEITKRLDEVRFLKSRKSARLQDLDTDYSKLADLQLSESKKRTVSSGIDVPSKQIRHWHPQQDDVAMEEESNHGIGSGNHGNIEMMDENIAAMVLTSLSCSPKSPQFNEYAGYQAKMAQLSTSASSSGFYSNQSERSDPSPPSMSHLSESAPAGSGMMFGPFSHDEGLDVDDDSKDGGNSSLRKVQKKTMYQCTWPNCVKISSTCSAIEKHVRDLHLGANMKEGSSESESNGEEEFYYQEIEVNVENVTQGFSDMCTSNNPSPPLDVITETQTFVIPDHDYQKKEFRQVFASSVPSSSTFPTHAKAVPIPIKVPEIQRSHSWQNAYTFSSSPSPPIKSRPSMQERLQQHQAQSPKIHTSPQKLLSIHKKPRSEVRKCRKVYGMENRDMWCTQCKWKKACTRFLD